MFRRILFGVAALAAVASPCLVESTSACTLTGTISAEVSQDPGFAQLWKYTIAVTWDTGSQGLSHTSIFLALDNLECRCHPGVILFDSPAGSSNGEDCNGGLDPVLYSGDYACMGDPTIPATMNAPAVKFEHQDNPDCEPGAVGQGTFVFYTPFPPAPYTENPSGLAVKYSQESCFGLLSGTPPLGDCAVPVVPVSWGGVKALHR